MTETEAVRLAREYILANEVRAHTEPTQVRTFDFQEFEGYEGTEGLTWAVTFPLIMDALHGVEYWDSVRDVSVMVSDRTGKAWTWADLDSPPP